MKITATSILLTFISFCFVLNTYSQTKYWGANFKASAKSRAVYFSTDKKEKEKKTKERSYFKIKDSTLIRVDLSTNRGEPMKVRLLYPSGKPKEIITFIGTGKKDQKTSYREDGTVRAIYNYKNSGVISQTLVYDKTEELIFEGNEEGPSTSYPNKKIRSRLTFKQNGPTTYYYETGEKLLSLDFQAGVKKGITASWYKNGQLRTSHKAEGIPINWWHPNGVMAVKHENSTVFRYDTAGVLREKYGIQEYRLDGPHTYYYPNGKISVSGQNKEGKRVGIWQFFSEKETLIKKIDFKTEQQEPRVIERSTLLLRRSVENHDPEMFYAGIPDFFDPRFHADQDVLPLNDAAIKQWVGYPAKAREARVQGTVVFRMLIDEHGRLVWYKTVNQVHPLLCHAIEKYLFDLIFEPAYRDGKAITSWINFPLNFRLLN